MSESVHAREILNLTMISLSQAQVTLRNSASALWFKTGQQYLTEKTLLISSSGQSDDTMTDRV